MEIQTKYSVGDPVWLMDRNKPHQSKIWKVEAYWEDDERNGVKYYLRGDSGFPTYEKALFATKQDLLNSL